MSKEDNKKVLEIGDTLYGINNEIYTIENIDNEQIVIKFYKKIYLTYNSGHNQEVKIKEEDLYFSFDDIGIQIFFKEGDCYKSVNELLDDTDYLNYIKNLNNRIANERINENFRNTKQISDFCNDKFKYNNLSMAIIGKNVEYIEKKKINNIILKKINEKKKIAIITQNRDDIENLIPIDSEYTFYGTIEQVKGIEFDSVIVFEDKMTKNEKYIAYTRALNDLYI